MNLKLVIFLTVLAVSMCFASAVTQDKTEKKKEKERKQEAVIAEYQRRKEAMEKRASQYEAQFYQDAKAETYATLEVALGGNYRFEQGDTLIEGRGNVILEGCILHLSDYGNVLADFDLCESSASARVWIKGGKQAMTLTESGADEEGEE